MSYTSLNLLATPCPHATVLGYGLLPSPIIALTRFNHGPLWACLVYLIIGGALLKMALDSSCGALLSLTYLI